jgi:hypothetical protein
VNTHPSRPRRLTPWRIPCLLAGLAAGVSLLASGPVLAVPPPVNVTLEPRQISMGDAAQLTITSTGSSMDDVKLPVVAGLEFHVVGQSRRVEIINGAMLSSTSVIVRVTPQTAGIFTIPGLTPQSEPLVLRVNPDNGSGGAPYNNPNGIVRPPVAANGSAPGGIRMTADGAAFVRMNLPKRDVYVGESIPVEIEVGMRAGFVTSLNGLPTLTGNDFTLNNLSRKPERVEKMIDGKPFTVLTWHSVLAPVKPGTFKLSVETPLTIRVRTRPAKDSMIDDLLGDPFMQNFFGATVPKEITAASPPGDLNVLPLPTEGRPADFSGAVGSFKIASDLSSPTAAVGDPLTLRLHVTGTGNFDRVDTSMLEHLAKWKTYPPKSTFTPADPTGYKGEKLFEQPLIAARPGAQTLPDLAFSYFDPNTRSYQTAHSAPPPVTIAPALADGTPPAGGAGGASGATTANDAGHDAAPDSGHTATPVPDGLRPDHAADGVAAAALTPLYLRPPYLLLPSLLALGFAGGWLRLRSRGNASLARGRRAPPLSQTASRLLLQMETAARSGDTVTFFTTARSALQQALSARRHVTPDAPTADAADAHWGSADDEVRQIFTLADEARYAGHGMTATDFEHWLGIVRRQLQNTGSPRT